MLRQCRLHLVHPITPPQDAAVSPAMAEPLCLHKNQRSSRAARLMAADTSLVHQVSQMCLCQALGATSDWAPPHPPQTVLVKATQPVHMVPALAWAAKSLHRRTPLSSSVTPSMASSGGSQLRLHLCMSETTAQYPCAPQGAPLPIAVLPLRAA